MNPWYILLIELVFIFLTSRNVFQSLFTLLYVSTKSQKVSVSLISLFFFPGTVLHELSHLIAAEVLRVKTHGMEFNPTYENGRLKMGSVKVSVSDPIRQFFIGIAPFVSGVLVLLSLLYIYTRYFNIFNSFQTLQGSALLFTLLLCVFIVTNTMFSSRKDMEGVIELLILGVIVFLVLFVLGLQPERIFSLLFGNKYLQGIIYSVVLFLAVPLGINLLVILATYPIIKKYTIR